MVASLLRLPGLDWPVPDVSTLCRRQKTQAVQVPSRRQWRKMHIALDTAASDIRAVEFTPSRDGDCPVLPALLGQIPEGEQIGRVSADGAAATPPSSRVRPRRSLRRSSQRSARNCDLHFCDFDSLTFLDYLVSAAPPCTPYNSNIA